VVRESGPEGVAHACVLGDLQASHIPHRQITAGHQPVVQDGEEKGFR
jgi:hypothetical protein